MQNGEELDEKKFILNADEGLVSATVRDLLLNTYELSENWIKNRVLVVSEEDHLMQAVEETILSFKEKTIVRMINDIQKEMKEMTDEEDIMILMSRLKGLKEISMKINGRLGRIIIK